MIFDDKILSIDSDDDNDNYSAFSKHLEDDTYRKKSKTASEIEQLGGQYVDEIERKKKQKLSIVRKQIPYILKKSNGKYSEEELLSYSFEDVKNIYDEIRYLNRPFIVKIFQFLFDL